MDMCVAFSTHDKTEADPLAYHPSAPGPLTPFLGCLPLVESPELLQDRDVYCPIAPPVSLPAA